MTSKESKELFPYESFGVRLEHKDEKKICWFKDDEDLQKYLNRYKPNKKMIAIDYRDQKSVQPKKSNRKKVIESKTNGKKTV